MHLDAFTSAAVYTSHIINGTSVYCHATTYRHICCFMAAVKATDYLIRYNMGMVLLVQPQVRISFVSAFLLTSSYLEVTVSNRPRIMPKLMIV
jgi:hypothetical protein